MEDRGKHMVMFSDTRSGTDKLADIKKDKEHENNRQDKANIAQVSAY